jgi:excisionase family DNA binding protein
MPSRRVSAAGADHAQDTLEHDRRIIGLPTSRHQSRASISFFTVSDVAEHLGVSTRTVRRWIDGRRLIAHHFGRAVRIAEEDLRAFLAAHRGEQP